MPPPTTINYHPPLSTTIHHYPPPAKTYPSPATITLHQPKYINHHHSPPAKIYPPPPTTTQHNPKYIHQHPPAPTNSQNLFLRNPFIRNLNSRPAIAKKRFNTWPSPLFLLIHQKWFYKVWTNLYTMRN